MSRSHSPSVGAERLSLRYKRLRSSATALLEKKNKIKIKFPRIPKDPLGKELQRRSWIFLWRRERVYVSRTGVEAVVRFGVNFCEARAFWFRQSNCQSRWERRSRGPRRPIRTVTGKIGFSLHHLFVFIKKMFDFFRAKFTLYERLPYGSSRNRRGEGSSGERDAPADRVPS